MKRFLVLTAIFTAVLLMISCGSDNKTENNEENPDSTETVTDEDPVETEPADNEQTDYETSDTTEPENDDSDNNENNDSDTEEVTKCRLDSTILDGEADSYFAFKGVGKIQALSLWYLNNEVKFDGIEGKTMQEAYYSAFSNSYLEWSNGHKEDGIEITVRDNNHYTATKTDIYSFVYLSRIMNLVENNIFEESLPPLVQFYDWTWTNDLAYVKKCIIATNKVAYNPDFDEETEIGKLKVCYENNNDFSVGETFKVAFFAELVTGQDLLDDYDVDSAEELCRCQNAETGDKVECSEISWD